MAHSNVSPVSKPTAHFPKSATGHRTRSKRSTRRYVIWGIAALLILAALGLLLKFLFKPAPPQPPPPVAVVAATVQSGDVPVYLTGLGAVQAYNTVTIHARVDGTLNRVAFVEGQDVKAGDVLAEIDPRPFQAQLDQVTAAKARDEALLANARLDLARYQKLVAEDSIAGQQRDTQAALVAQYAATVKNDQGQIDYAAVQLGYTKITSPIDGRTGVRMIDTGNIVHATDTTGLVVVTQIEPISVVFTLPEDDFETVNKQMPTGPLSVVASSRSDNAALGQGNLLLINNQIDQTTGTIQLKATFPNKDHALWPGQFVNARLRTETRHNAITVPSAAVQRGPQGVFAYVIQPDGTAQIRPITVSAASTGGPTTLIESGLTAGEQVVIDGQLKLHPGVKVKAVAPQPATPAPAPAPGQPSAK